MNLSSIKIMIACLVALSLMSCKAETDQTQESEHIQDAWNQFVENWNNMNTEGCMDIYAEGAVVIPPQMEIAEGRQSIAEFYDYLFSTNKSADYTHTTESISFSGNQAIEHGSFSVDWISNEGNSWTFNARAMIHWEKDPSGHWKIKKLLFNTPPVPES